MNIIESKRIKGFKKKISNVKLNIITSIMVPNDVLNIIFSKTSFQSKRAVFCLSKYWRYKFTILNKYEARRLAIFFANNNREISFLALNKVFQFDYKSTKILFNFNPISSNIFNNFHKELLKNYHQKYIPDIITDIIRLIADKEYTVIEKQNSLSNHNKIMIPDVYISIFDIFIKLAGDVISANIYFILHRIFVTIKSDTIVKHIINSIVPLFVTKSYSCIIFEVINISRYHPLIVDFLSDYKGVNCKELFYFSLFYDNYELSYHILNTYKLKEYEFVDLYIDSLIFYKAKEAPCDKKKLRDFIIEVNKIIYSKIKPEILVVNISSRYHFPELDKILVSCVKHYAKTYTGISKLYFPEYFVKSYHEAQERLVNILSYINGYEIINMVNHKILNLLNHNLINI